MLASWWTPVLASTLPPLQLPLSHQYDVQWGSEVSSSTLNLWPMKCLVQNHAIWDTPLIYWIYPQPPLNQVKLVNYDIQLEQNLTATTERQHAATEKRMWMLIQKSSLAAHQSEILNLDRPKVLAPILQTKDFSLNDWTLEAVICTSARIHHGDWHH